MSIKIIYGRAGSGKSQQCLEEIKLNYLAGNKKIILIVPEQFTFEAERALSGKLGLGGIIGAEVLSFRRLAHRVMNEVGGVTAPLIHPAGKCMIIYRILDKLKDELSIFSKSADSKGFVNTISTLITEMKRYEVNVQRLGKTIEQLEDAYLKEKLTEISTIYTEFEKMLGERFRDADDELTQLSKKIGESEQCSGASIWIDGFSGFTPQEYSVIEQLLLVASDVTITLCTDVLAEEGGIQDTDVFSSVKYSYKKLMRIANSIGTVVKTPINANSFNNGKLFRMKDSDELIHLESNFFSYPNKSFSDKTEDIILFEAGNIYTEVEQCAKYIIKQCRDNGRRYKDISVVTRNLEGYKNIIEAIFSEYEIPFFIDSKSDITNHPLVRLVLSLLDIFNNNWTYEDVFSYLKAGLLSIPSSDIDLIENYVLACGIRGSRWYQAEDWKMSPELFSDKNEGQDEEFLLRINEIRTAIIEPLVEFRGRTKGRNTAAAFCEAIYVFLEKTGVFIKITQLVDFFNENGQRRLASEYQQVWNILMDVFDQIVEVMGEETVSTQRFTNIFRIGLAEYKISTIPASVDQIIVGSAEHSKSTNVTDVYILGVNDGVFPSTGMGEGILNDQDRNALLEKGLELASDTRAKAFDEQFLIYKTLTAASKRLTLSWPVADSQGKTLRPSTLISRLKRIFRNITTKSNVAKTTGSNVINTTDRIVAKTTDCNITNTTDCNATKTTDNNVTKTTDNNVTNTTDSTDSYLDHIAAKNPAFRQLVCQLRGLSGGGEVDAFWKEVYAWFLKHEDWKSQCEMLTYALNYKNISNAVSREKVLSLYGINARSSVSRIEKYSVCPFAYYVQFGLKAKERKLFQLRAPDVGSFMHAVIEKFAAVLKENEMTWRDFDRDWCNEQVGLIVSDVLSQMKMSSITSSARYKALMTRLRRVIARSIWMIAQHIRMGSFNPAGYEVDFGEKSELPPVVIELNTGEKVSFIGRIDRVDTLETEEGTYVRIVDYKSGNKDFSLSDALNGLQLQLITYMDALQEGAARKFKDPIIPGGMLYFRLDDPIVSAKSGTASSDIELAIMKKLKMNGLLLGEVKLITEMDKSISGTSIIIPARINKDGQLGKPSSTASREQFSMLRKYTKRLLTDLFTEIMKGNVAIRPYRKNKQTGCDYCSYQAVCQFDPTMSENSYRQLFDKKDDEVWSIMKGTDNQNGR